MGVSKRCKISSLVCEERLDQVLLHCNFVNLCCIQESAYKNSLPLNSCPHLYSIWGESLRQPENQKWASPTHTQKKTNKKTKPNQSNKQNRNTETNKQTKNTLRCNLFVIAIWCHIHLWFRCICDYICVCVNIHTHTHTHCTTQSEGCICISITGILNIWKKIVLEWRLSFENAL